MININKVSVKNVGPWKELELDTNNRGVMLLVGNIGSGKSTILDILQLGLYGKSQRYFSYKDLIRKGEKESSIEISGDKEGKPFRIVRVMTSGSQRLILYVGDDNVSGVHLESTQEKINNLLKTDWSVFSNIVTVSGEPVLFKETDGYQKTFMERMLGFEVYSRGQDISKDYKTILEDKLSELKFTLSNKTHKINMLKQQIDMMSQKEEDVKNAKIAQLTEQIKDFDTISYDLGTSIDYTNKEIEKVTKELTELSESNKSVEAELLALTQRREELSIEYTKAESRVTEVLRKFNLCKTGICPVCDRDLEGTSVLKITESLLSSSRSMADQVAKEQKENTILINKYRENNTRVKTEELESELRDLQYKLESMTHDKLRTVKQIMSLNAKIDDIQLQVGPGAKNLVNELDTLEKDILEVSKEITEAASKVEALDFCIEAFGDKGIKSLQIEQYLSSISENLNDNLENITEGIMSAFIVPLAKTRTSKELKDKMNLKVINRMSGEEFLDYRHCSTGQRACINVSALFAFHDILSKERGINWNILVLDEVLDSLDRDRLNSVVNLLSRMSDKFPTIILTSHRQEFHEAFSNKYFVKATSEGSILSDKE